MTEQSEHSAVSISTDAAQGAASLTTLNSMGQTSLSLHQESLYSMNVLSISKKQVLTTTTTTVTAFNTNRKFPKKFQHEKLNTTNVEGGLPIGEIKFDQYAYNMQAQLIDTFPQLQDNKIEVLEMAAKLADKLDDSEGLKNGLKDAKDQLDLIPLQESLSEAFQRIAVKDMESETAHLFLELLCFTAAFPKNTSFIPLDASTKAFDVACSAEPGALQSTLLVINKSLNTDFIDRKYQNYLLNVLAGYANIHVQELRWIIKNIEEKLVLDGPSDQNIVTERNAILPVLPEKEKPASSSDLGEIIKNCKKYSDKVLELIGESSEDKIQEWSSYFKEVTKMFKILRKAQTHDKIVERRKVITELQGKLEDFSKLAESAGKDLKRNSSRLQSSAQALFKYVSFLDENGLITFYTVSNAIAQAQSYLAQIIDTSGSPSVIERAAVLDSTLTKLRSNIISPSIQQNQIITAQNTLSSILQITENKDAVSYLQVALWELKCKNIRRLTILSRIQVVINDYQSIEKLLNVNIDKAADEEQSKIARKFLDSIPSKNEKLRSIMNSDEPENNSNEKEYISQREELDPIIPICRNLSIELETASLSHDIEKLISVVKGENYTYVSKVVVPRTQSKNTRVMFASGSEKDYAFLFPKAISHPVYSSWDTKSLLDHVKTSKQVPIDIEMLSKVTMGKLNSKRSRFASLRRQIYSFKQYQLRDPKDLIAYTSKNPEEVENAYLATEKSISLIEKEIFRIGKKTLFEKFEFIEQTAPALQAPCFKDDDSLQSRYAKIYSRYNNVINTITTEHELLLPRPAVDHASKYVNCIILVLNKYHEILATKSNTSGLQLIERWLDYLGDMSKILNMINNADDEIAIIAAKNFFLNFRSGLASFTLPSETLDGFVGHRSLSALTLSALKILLIIIQFIQNVSYEEFCTTNVAQSQLDELDQKFKSSHVALQQKKLFEELSSDVRAIISATDVNTSKADAAAMKLREVHLSLESDIKSLSDEEMTLFLSTIGVRYSITNLHVSDSEPDVKLTEMANALIGDFNNLINQLKIDDDSNQTTISRLSNAWINHIVSCQTDIQGMTSVAGIVTYSPTRYQVIADNAEDIFNSLTTLEDKRFPFSVSSYSKLSLHLDKFIDYVKNKPINKKGARATHRQTDLSSVLQKHLISLQTPTKVIADDDKYFEEFADGFIQGELDIQSVHAQISDSVAQHTEILSSDELRVEGHLGRLFSAHLDAFSRNYNICSKSTRVCYELLTNFCKSIAESTILSNKVLYQNGNEKDLENLVNNHINTIQEIQNQYNDKTVYSDFGRQRILLFAHFCCVSAQLTLLHIYCMKDNDEPFDFDEIQVHSRAVGQIFNSLSENFDSQTVLANLADVEKVCRSFNDDTQFPVMDLLNIERKYVQSLNELVEVMMLEPDVRFWKARDVELVLSTPEIEKSDEIEKTTFSDLKRSIDIVTEQLMHFKSTLQDSDVAEGSILAQLGAIDEVTKVFCQSALSIDSDLGFEKLVRSFRQDTVSLVNYLRYELINGSYQLYSNETERILQQVNDSAISIIRQLGHLEMIEEKDAATLNSLLTRLIKQLLLSRDELKKAADKTQKPPVIQYSIYAASTCEVIANVMLAIKNSSPMIIKALQTTKVKSLRRLIFVTQEFLDVAQILEAISSSYLDYSVESPEFLVKANFEPVLQILTNMKESIPCLIPHAGSLVHLISSIIAKMNIIIQPHFEDRPLLDLTVQ